MKQAIYVMMALLVVGMASAVTVDCGQDKWYDWDSGDCRAYELQPTFDEVTDMIDDIDVTITSNNESWLAGDGRGTSLNRVIEYLTEDFVPMLRGIFATKDEVAALQDTLYEHEAIIYFLVNDIDFTDEMVFDRAVFLEMAETGSNTVEHNGRVVTRFIR